MSATCNGSVRFGILWPGQQSVIEAPALFIEPGSNLPGRFGFQGLGFRFEGLA